jgi:hemerythrin
MTIAWHEEYSVHVALLDEQHKELVRAIDLVAETMRTGKPLDPAIAILKRYVTLHFETEEKLFAQCKFSGQAEHKRLHDEFRTRLLSMIRSRKDDHRLSADLIDVLEDWLLDHLLHADKQYVECFRAHGLK